MHGGGEKHTEKVQLGITPPGLSTRRDGGAVAPGKEMRGNGNGSASSAKLFKEERRSDDSARISPPRSRAGAGPGLDNGRQPHRTGGNPFDDTAESGTTTGVKPQKPANRRAIPAEAGRMKAGLVLRTQLKPGNPGEIRQPGVELPVVIERLPGEREKRGDFGGNRFRHSSGGTFRHRVVSIARGREKQGNKREKGKENILLHCRRRPRWNLKESASILYL